MFQRLFPKTADNAGYRGHWLAIVLLVVTIAMRALMGATSIFNAHDTAINADRIPLGSYGADATATIVGMFGLLGWGYILLAILGAVVLVRYRALIPFFFLLLLVNTAGRMGVHALLPIPESGGTMAAEFSVGTLVTDALLGALVLGFVLSLVDTKRSTP